MSAEPKFAVIVLTAPPPGLAQEAGGATVRVDGREALLRSVELFLSRGNVVQTQLVVAADQMAGAKDKFGPHLSFGGVRLTAGGPRWVDQIAAAAAAVPPEATHVVVHDAARPVVPSVDVDALLAAAADHPAVALATPVRTATVEVDEGGQPMAVQPPAGRMHLLTPQAFDRATFEAVAKTRAEPHPSKLTLVNGSAYNVRVGSAADAVVAKAFLALMPKPKAKPASSPFEEAQW